MKKQRGGELIIVIGHNNTGKTVFATRLADGFNKRRDSVNLKSYPSNYYKLAVYDVQNRFSKHLRKGDLSIKTSDKDWCKKLLKMRKSLVILDDYKVLLPNDKMDSDLLDLLQFRAEYGIDIILIVHNPKLILERLSYYVDTYCLFYTAGNSNSFKGRVSGAERLIELKKVIDKEYKSYTREEYGNLYPNFPFIFYNGRNEEAKYINFKK